MGSSAIFVRGPTKMAKPTFTMQVSTPKLNKDGVRVELQKALREHGKSLVKVFDTTTASWESDKPKFNPVVSLTEGEGAGLDVVMTGSALAKNKWLWLDRGTKPHVIEARNARVLAFQSDHAPKTVPGFIGSGPGGASGETVFRQSVNHPGTEAREWSKDIREQVKPIFRDDMQAALAAGLARARRG